VSEHALTAEAILYRKQSAEIGSRLAASTWRSRL